jgi:hypothetical protein
MEGLQGAVKSASTLILANLFSKIWAATISTCKINFLHLLGGEGTRKGK